MGTLTAQILTGTAHPNHGGINPSHYLFLSENSRSVWILVPQNIIQEPDGQKTPGMIRWIPTTENMLEDALLMIAIHVLRDKTVLERIEKFPKIKSADFVHLNKDIDKKAQLELYEICRRIKNRYKAVITVLEGSSIRSQLEILEKYQMDVEVCVSVYLRQYSMWSKGTDDFRITKTLTRASIVTRQEGLFIIREKK